MPISRVRDEFPEPLLVKVATGLHCLHVPGANREVAEAFAVRRSVA